HPLREQGPRAERSFDLVARGVAIRAQDCDRLWLSSLAIDDLDRGSALTRRSGSIDAAGRARAQLASIAPLQLRDAAAGDSIARTDPRIRGGMAGLLLSLSQPDGFRAGGLPGCRSFRAHHEVVRARRAPAADQLFRSAV